LARPNSESPADGGKQSAGKGMTTRGPLNIAAGEEKTRAADGIGQRGRSGVHCKKKEGNTIQAPLEIS